VHVISSVGWLGAVAVFLVLAIVGLTSQNDQTARAVYIAMELAAQFIIVPLCFAALLTGLFSSLVTDWGLIRYYWILTKLMITIISTIGLLVHLQPIRNIANVAARTTLSESGLHQVQVQLVVVSGGALLALVVATTLSMYKPRGLTPYGWRKKRQPAACHNHNSLKS
jgi:hypothetical protein